MAQKEKEISQLRRELEALRNQVKAYGISESSSKEKKNMLDSSIFPKEDYAYVFYDLRNSLFFILFAIFFIIAVGIFVASFPAFSHLRELLHISQLKF